MIYIDFDYIYFYSPLIEQSVDIDIIIGYHLGSKTVKRTQKQRNQADSMTKISNAEVRKLNRRKQIVNLIKEHGKLSKNELAKLTHNSISTVIAAVDELHQDGVIEQSGIGQASAGRPPVYYSLRSDYGYSVGIDFNSESIHIAVINLRRENVYTVEQRMEKSQDSIKDIVPRAQQLLDQVLSAIPGQKVILCIGIASPGPFDFHAKRLLYYTQSVDILTPFAERYHCPVYANNNLNCLALAYKERAEKPINNMILIGMRAGVGMSCILDGNIFTGYSGQAGAIGHTRLPVSTAVCKCGKIGCLDAELSIYAITRKMEALLGETRDENGQLMPTTQKMDLFVQRVREGQPDCLHVLDESCYYLSLSVTQIINLFNPSDLFFYGEITQCGEIFLDYLRKYLDQKYLNDSLQHVSLSLTTLSEFAFAEGAAYYALDQYFSPEVI